MKIFDLVDGFAQFDVWFKKAGTSLFRGEFLLEHSDVDEGPSFTAWRAGETDRANELVAEQLRPWIEQCKGAIPVTKARVVERPYSQYVQWLLACVYPYLVQTNRETIYLVPKDKLENVLMPYGDFWIFDDQRVIEWKFEGPENKAVGAMIIEGRHAVDRYLALRDELLDNADKFELP